MKNITLFLVILVLCALVPQSCDDILSEPAPPTEVPIDQATNTLAGIQAIRTAMYSTLSTVNWTTEYMLAPSSLADDLFKRPGTNRYSGKNENTEANTAGSWGDTGDDAPGEGYDDSSYKLINTANIILNAINEEVVPEDLLTTFRGEAYFFRAFAMHHLARVYGYEPGAIPQIGGGAGFNLSIIIRTEPILEENKATYAPRATIQETYEQIESDLKNAISLLSQSSGQAPDYISQAAAEAMLARVYLYWRKWDLAAQYATDALSHTSAQLTTPSQVANMFISGNTTGDIFVLTINPETEFDNAVNDALAAYTSDQWMAQVPTQDLMDIYSSDDARLAWFTPCFKDVEGKEVTNCLATHPAIAGGAKTLELHKWQGDKGSFVDDIPYFRVAELIFIQAEGHLKGSAGAAAAEIDLNKIRTNRGLAPYAGLLTQDAIMQAILLGRRREFVGEGHRFFDLKRLGMGIQKAPGVTPPDPKYSDISGDLVLPYTDYRVLDRVPISEVVQSEAAAARGDIPQDSVLVQNPGYK